MHDPVSQSVCLSVTREGCAQKIERIDVLLGVETLGATINIVLDGGAHSPQRGEGGSMRPLPHYISHSLVMLLSLRRNKDILLTLNM